MSEEEKVIVERYVIHKSMHLGPLRRDVRPGMELEWYPQTQTLKINGSRVEEGNGVSPSEAMRQLRVLSERTPDEPVMSVASTEEDSEKEPLRTQTLCVLPVLGCLSAAAKYLEAKGHSPEMSPSTDEQAQFLEMFEDLMNYVPDVKELESMASEDVADVNNWLAAKGYDIRLQEGAELSMASVFELLLEWMTEGSRSSVTAADGKDYTAVLVKKNVTVAHEMAVHSNPVVRVMAKTGETVCMSIVDEVPDSFAGLFLKVAELDSVKSTSHQFDGATFPMVDLDVRPDISFINGLEMSPDFFVGKAIQQTRFRMNEKGAKVESAAAMQLFRSVAMRVPYSIDRPFLLWIRRDGFEFPLFAAVLCEDVWKEPQKL